ncbi:MAG: Bug family tripartite tricarboxylate transporter substrate binding protein [Bilophila wadsworthia]
MKLLSCLRTALCLLGLLAMPAAAAYPEKPINMIIAFTAGGSSDVQARIMQKYWNKYAPQPWVFVYKPGAGGIIGFTEIAKARPDGYTIGGLNVPHIILSRWRRTPSSLTASSTFTRSTIPSASPSAKPLQSTSEIIASS